MHEAASGIAMTASALARLKATHPWPDISALDGEPPLVWNLDGGGRDLLIEFIKRAKPKVMLEVGAFLGGSALQWLAADESLTLILLDSWTPAAGEWVGRIIDDPPPAWTGDPQSLIPIRDALERHGIMSVALHNLRAYQQRTIPIQMTAEVGYAYLAPLIEPDIVFIDANKEFLDYSLADEVFPYAILCGDDWSWHDADGAYPVRRYVHEIAERRRCDVVAQDATWILAPKNDY